MKKIGLVLALVLGLTSIASAELDLQWSSTSDGVVDIYTLTLVGTNGSLPSGWDGVITGDLEQVKAFGALDTPDMQYAGMWDLTKDSHYLVTDKVDVLSTALSETATSLTGAFALTSPTASSWNFAQVVVAAGSAFNVVGSASDAANGNAMTALQAEVPEPATMALLGLGGLGLIRRRRA